MANLSFVGEFIAIDAPEFFENPDFQSWLETRHRASWDKEHFCCDAVFMHVVFDDGTRTGEKILDGSDISFADPTMPDWLGQKIIGLIEDAGFGQFDGIIWLRGTTR